MLCLAASALWLSPSRSNPSQPPSAQTPAGVPAVVPSSEWADATLPGDEGEKVRFDFQLVQWDLAKVEEVARDESGHRHHVRLPPKGFTWHHMFGRNWNGAQPPVLLRDHPDFAPSGPFHIEATVMFDEDRHV